MVEIEYLGTPQKVAINEAVELAKRYSGEDGYRFINGVSAACGQSGTGGRTRRKPPKTAKPS